MMSGDWKGIFSSSRFKYRWNSGSSPTTGLLDNVPPEIELSDYRRLPGSGSESPSGLLNGEGLKAEPIADLDLFFERLYNYYCEKGLLCIIIKWIVEILSLGFAICFSGFFLLIVDWHGLRNAKCGMDAVESGRKPCDLAKEALNSHPLVPFTFWKGIVVVYLGMLTIYWLICFLRFFIQLKDILEVRKFYYNSLNVTDRELQTTSWPAILEKVIQSQRSHKLCVVKDLSAHDMVMRIMRKENYLIGMINKGVLAFQIPWWVPWVGPTISLSPNGRKSHLTLTKTLEWAINWCILQTMFDRNFRTRRDFISNPSSLRKRLMIVGIGMLLVSPFLVIFMLVYLFLRHAEQFYNHPSTASSRRWSNLSKWIFREFNEVDHLFKHRINSSVEHASDYLKQFPSPIIFLVAKFISFVCGGFAAILIIIAFLEESLLEGHILGRNLFWYAAVFGTVIAISRSAVSDELQVLDPEGAMSLVVQHTHYMPKRWRGKENTDAVRTEFESMFQYTGMMLLEELASIFLTPYLLIFVVPKSAKDILQFISEFTVDVEGIGHVCSLSVFDFQSHGNSKYGSPYNSLRDRRSSQGKMEKSFLSFQSAYPTWEPNAQGQQFLANLSTFREQRRCKEAQGVPSRDVPHYIRGIPQSTGHNLGSLWQINPERRISPYLLDWYYLSGHLNATDEPKYFMAGPSELAHGLRGLWSPKETEAKVVEQKYNIQPSDRRQSHFEASTSSPYVPGSVLQHHDWDRPEDPTESQFWDRPAPKPSGPHTSFLEPPSSYGHPNYGHHNHDVLSRSLEDLEEGHGSIYSIKSGSLSRTMYLDDSEHELNLPFLDIYNAPLDSSKSGSPSAHSFQ